MERGKVNPITVEVIRSALVNIAGGMRATVERTAYSPVIFEEVDFSCGIFDTGKRLIAEFSGIPVFLANLWAAIGEIEKVIGFNKLEPGDIIFCNDPYSGGFTHTPDVTCIAPVFYEDKLVLFTAFKGHTLDMGGIYAGGWYNNTTETYQEGLALPPVKLYKRGKENEDLFRVIRRNIRLPKPVIGDIRAMVSSIRVGAKDVVELITKYGLDVFWESVEQFLNNAERKARKAMEEISDGEYSDYFYCDGGGDDWKRLGDKLKVQVNIKVRGDEMEVDVEGSAAQNEGPMNCPYPTTLSQIRYGFKCLTTPEDPANEGHFRPLKVKEPPSGSIFNPKMPAATSLLWCPSTSLPDLMLKALSSAIPEKARAGHFGDVCADFIYGRGLDDELYILAEPTAGGWGGKPNGEDGETMFCMADGDTYNLPAEVLEVRYPLRVVRYELIQDSGGAGKFRGGLGVSKEYTPIGHDAKLTATFDRSKYSPAWGLFGGQDGKPNQIIILRKDGSRETYGKVTDLTVKEGDIIILQGGGGGGYGDPLERDPERVREDVENEKVSVERARESYGVILTDSLEIDWEETKRLRERRKTASASHQL